MTQLACIGHWYVSLIYAVPAFLLGGGLAISTLREKRRKAPGEQPAPRRSSSRRRARSSAA